MDNIDIPKLISPIDATKSSGNLLETLAGMYPETDELYKKLNKPANLLQSKLIKYRYFNIPTNNIIEPTSDPEERQIFSDAMEEDVRNNIATARTGTPVDAYQAALTMANTLNGVFTFGSWYAYRDHLLGGKRCQQIGEKVVSETNFTKEEAAKIMAKYKNAYLNAMKQAEERIKQER